MTLLTTTRLVIRPFGTGDAAQFVRAVLESGATLKPTMPWWSINYSKEDALEFFAGCADKATVGSAQELGIFDRDSKDFIGGIGINRIDPDYRIGNLGYWVRESRQNHGYCTEAAEAMIRFGLDTLKLVRLEIVIMADNAASRRVAEKLGAKLECVAANRLMHHGVAVPAAVYSIVSE